jgi:DNA-binding transcriptional LysR family regulator
VDKWEAMRVFVRVVESGSFVRAAQKLELSTTATSRLLAELESHLGTRLLQRSTRRLNLTEAGQRFYARAGQLLLGLDEAEAEVGVVTREPTGLLRVSVPISFGVLHLAKLLPAYRTRYPEVRLEVLATDRKVDLVDEGFDLAVRLATHHRPTYVARQLAPIRMVVCAAPAYLARHGTPDTPLALAAHNCLTHPSGGYPDHWVFQGPEGPTSVHVCGAYRADNGDLLRAAALAGEGIILEPTFIVGEDLARGDLVPLLSEWPVPQATAMAVYPTRRFLSAKVRTFVEFLQEAFTGQPAWDRWMT